MSAVSRGWVAVRLRGFICYRLSVTPLLVYLSRYEYNSSFLVRLLFAYFEMTFLSIAITVNIRALISTVKGPRLGPSVSLGE